MNDKNAVMTPGEAEGPGTSLALVPGQRPAVWPSTPESLLLRPREAARLLRIGRSKLFEMLAAGELPVVRIGRCVRIPRRELRLWIEDQLDRGSADPGDDWWSRAPIEQW